MARPPEIWMPALTAGAIFGFLSGVPFVGALNCACCSLLVGAGVLVAFQLARASELPLTYGRAALGGAVSGIVAAPVSLVTHVCFSLALGKDVTDQFQEAFDQASQMSPDASEAAQMLAGIAAPFLLALLLVIEVILYTPFAALGGVIGRVIFERRPSPPPAGSFPAGPPQVGPSVGPDTPFQP